MRNQIHSLIDTTTSITAIKEQAENVFDAIECTDIFPLIIEALSVYLTNKQDFKMAINKVAILQSIYYQHLNNEACTLLNLTHPEKEKQ